MARVFCTLQHASDLINGVRFVEDRGQMISEEVPDEVAANFASIPGYHRIGKSTVELAAEAEAARIAAEADTAAAEAARVAAEAEAAEAARIAADTAAEAARAAAAATQAADVKRRGNRAAQ